MDEHEYSLLRRARFKHGLLAFVTWGGLIVLLTLPVALVFQAFVYVVFSIGAIAGMAITLVIQGVIRDWNNSHNFWD